MGTPDDWSVSGGRRTGKFAVMRWRCGWSSWRPIRACRAMVLRDEGIVVGDIGFHAAPGPGPCLIARGPKNGPSLALVAKPRFRKIGRHLAAVDGPEDIFELEADRAASPEAGRSCAGPHLSF